MPQVQVEGSTTFMMDREEDQNTSMVVITNEVSSRGMKRLHKVDNSNFL
jgi:hypothetical protein